MGSVHPSKKTKSAEASVRTGIAKKQNSTKANSSMIKSSPRKATKATTAKSTTAHTNARHHKTKIVVKCNCGFANKLFLRGEGIAGLNWDRGIQLKNVKADEWVWETDKPFNMAEIKVLLNDKEYEAGENHKIECGKATNFSPKF